MSNTQEARLEISREIRSLAHNRNHLQGLPYENLRSNSLQESPAGVDAACSPGLGRAERLVVTGPCSHCGCKCRAELAAQGSTFAWHPIQLGPDRPKHWLDLLGPK